MSCYYFHSKCFSFKQCRIDYVTSFLKVTAFVLCMLNSFVSVYINNKWDIKEYFSCNFNFRNPNGNSSGLWTPYTLKGREFINLDLNITMASSLYKDRVHFWLTTVPNLVQGCQSNSVNSAPTDILNILLVIVVLLTPLCIFC